MAEDAIVSGLAKLRSLEKMLRSSAVARRYKNRLFKLGLQNGSRGN